MDSVYTIVVPESEVLSQLCGTNDSNLRLIEQYLGVPIYTRGNELTVSSDNPEVHQKFKFVVDRILDEVHDGAIAGFDLVNSVFNATPSFIQIPGGLRRVYPKTTNQSTLINEFRANDMVFAVGPAGSGKTFLAIAEALRLVLSHEKRSIILTRPVVEAGESLGFLPGDLEQKINPYLRPLYDSIENLIPQDMLRKLNESAIIEVAPLAYMRGRTLNNSVIILDEAQNTTVEQMKMFLTRMGEGSKVFITGDVTQVDLPRRVRSGLSHAVSLLRNVEGISVVQLEAEDVVRNPLVRKIIQAYEHDEQEESGR